MKTKQSKWSGKRPEEQDEHLQWTFPPVYVSPPDELPKGRDLDGGVDFRSICGGIDESQPVEQYDGTLGVPAGFVRQHERAVGQVQWNSNLTQRYKDPGTVSGLRWASGTLISRDLFLTAGHTFDTNPGFWRVPRRDGDGDQPIDPVEIATNMHVNFNFQVDPSGKIRREDSFPVVELIEYRQGGLDYAIVRLGGQPGDRYGQARLSVADSQDGDMLCIIQHPEGQPKRIDAGPQFHSHETQIGYDSIDTLGGSSGAGILDAITGQLVGIHTHGGCTSGAVGHNHGVRLSAIAKVSATLKRLFSPGWVQVDLHELTEAPKIKSDPSFYAAPGSMHIVYRSGERLHELRRTGSWQHHAITAPDIELPPAQGNPTAYALFGNRTRYASYLGRDQHIHQLWWDGEWHHIDVSAESGAPPAAGEPAPHISFDGNSQQLYFTGADGHLYLLWWAGRWNHAALSAATDAADATGRPAVSSTGRDQRIYVAYRGRNSQVHLLYKEQTNWNYVAIGEQAHAPKAAADPRIALLLGDDFPRVYYRSTDDDIIQIYWVNGQWLYRNLSVAASAPPADDEPSVAVAPDASFATLFFRSKDDQIFQLEWRDNAWKASNLSAAAQAPDATGTPAGVLLYPASHRMVVYRGKENHLHEISWEEG